MVTTSPEVSPPPPEHGGTDGSEQAHEVDPDDRVYQPMSLRGPAFIVLGIAVFIVLAGVLASIFGTGGPSSPAVRSVTIPDGTVVHLTPATKALASIVSAGQPPADILGPLDVPAGSVITDTVSIDQNAGQFDRRVAFRSGLASGQILDLYRKLLPELGWKITYSGPSQFSSVPGNEVLATKGSTDTFYWEVGVVVSPTTSAGVTPFSLEVIETPDPV